MRVDDTLQNQLNVQNQLASSQTPQGHPDHGSNTGKGHGKEHLRPMRSYKGHGMIEQYPANLTVAYVSGHENRHAHKNRAQAGGEGESPDQNVSYNVQISSNGRIRATGGVTKSRRRSKVGSMETAQKSLKDSAPREGGALSPDDFKSRVKEFHLARQKETLETKLRGVSNNNPFEKHPGSAQLPNDTKPGLTDSSEKKSSFLSENIEKLNIRRKIVQVEEQKNQIARTGELDKITKEASAKWEAEAGSHSGIPKSAPIPEEEHVDLSRVAPASYHFAKRAIPNTELTHGFGATFEINNILNLTERFRPKKSVPVNVETSSKTVLQKLTALDNIGSRLSNLKIASGGLGTNQAFNARTSNSSFTEAVSAQTTAGSPIGSYRVSVNEIALPHKIVSASQADGALGLSGSFKINGYQVDVETTDTLVSIRDKINYGEDVNKNGALDYAEDLNENGSLDSWVIRDNEEFIFEDVDFDGALDSTEDVNGNEILDGGTSMLGVVAEVQDNRLKISTLDTGNRRITVDDTDELLLGLGFFYENSDQEIKEKDHFNSDYSEQLNSSPTMSNFSVNGANFERSFNSVNDVIPNTKLNLKQTTSEPLDLNIKSDTGSLQGKIEKFVEEYNSSMKTLNNFLAFQKTLQENATVQNLRARLSDNINRPVDSLSRENNSLESVGLELQNREKRSLSSFSLVNVVKSVLDNQRAVDSYRAQGNGAIYSQLRQLGIRTGEDDTLKIDEKRLSSVAEGAPMDLSRVFTNEKGGISKRIEDFVSGVTEKQGNLNLEKTRIKAHAGKLSKSKNAIVSAETTQKFLKPGNSQIARNINAYV